MNRLTMQNLPFSIYLGFIFHDKQYSGVVARDQGDQFESALLNLKKNQ